MSWLKDKLFGAKPRLNSFSVVDSDTMGSSNAQYCQTQLKNFIAKGQELKTYIVGYELVSEERYIIYKIAVSALGQHYTIDRRYSEFKELHDFSVKTYPLYKFSNFPGKSVGLFKSYNCPVLIQSRINAFNEMLSHLSAICSKNPDTHFLEWLELDHNLLIQMSPVPSKRRLVKSIMENSYTTRSVFSEEAKQLKQFLLDLDSEQETQLVLKEIEIFIFSPENRWRLKTDDISRFLLGDTESKGFLYYCFQVKHGCHYFCCLFLETLNKMLSKSFNPSCNMFRQMITSLPLTRLKQLGIGAHVETSGFKRCKQFSFELVALFEAVNPRSNFGSLFISAKMKAAYMSWKEKQPLIETVHPCSPKSPTLCRLAVDSAYNILSQPIEAEDLDRKKQVFMNKAEAFFKDSSANEEDILVKVDLENCDMAAMKCTFALDASVESPGPMNSNSAPTSPLQQENQVDVSLLLQQADDQIDTAESSFKGKLEDYLKNAGAAGTDHVLVTPRLDNTVDIRVTHKNTVFSLKLKTRSTDPCTMNKGVIDQLEFETVMNSTNTLKVDPLETSIEMKVFSGRKISFGCTCSDGLPADKCCSSTVSTTCNSETALTSYSEPQLVCNIEGCLTISEDTSAWNQLIGQRSYSMNLLILAKDQGSRSFIRSMPAIRHSLKHVFLQLYSVIRTQ